MNEQTPKSRRLPVRRWLPWVGAAVLVGLVVAGLWPKPAPVEIAQVTRGPLHATVNEEGKTRIKQRYVVSAPVTGQLRRIPYKAGARMIQGDTVVAIIDPVSPTLLDPRARAQAVARREAAAANLEKARASHAFAKSELKRHDQLFAQKTISQQELETVQLRETAAQREVEVSEGTLRQAEAELAQIGGQTNNLALTGLEPVILKAPETGQVLKVLEESSRVVVAGTPLVEIGDPTDLEVVIECLSRDGAAISPGARVEFDQWGGATPLQGTVRLVEPAAFTKISALGVEEQRVNVIADLVTPPAQRPNVGDQFRVEARIFSWESPDVVKVPSGALFRRANDWAAFVVADGRARLRGVKAGNSSETETQILEGLTSGEKVVLYPGSRMADGLRVQILTISSGPAPR